MIEFFAVATVVAAAIFLVGLAAFSLLAPAFTRRFLSQFAASAKAHYVEMLLRLIVGCAFVINAPNMLYSSAFRLFGWVLLVSSMVLILLPWRWHQRFAHTVVPPISRQVWLFGSVALPLGGVILFAVFAVQ